MKLSDDTFNCLCRDAQAHLATASLATAGFDFASVFKALWPYILEAIQALVAGGNLSPTPAQVLLKSNELATLRHAVATP
jgi:hypothetical protein